MEVIKSNRVEIDEETNLDPYNLEIHVTLEHVANDESDDSPGKESRDLCWVVGI